MAAATLASPRALVLFDLDGFKRYNDTFGHPAGDALLARLGEHLRSVVAPWGSAYRLGGDEFCILVDRVIRVCDAIVAAARAALSEEGDGFTVDRLLRASSTCPRRPPIPPRRCCSPTSACTGTRTAGGPPRSPRRVTSCSASCASANPSCTSISTTSRRSRSASRRRMGVEAEQIDEIARAAELHDIGKMAIPDAILSKPGPLDAEEWEFMRSHTLIGERILGAAPALRAVGDASCASSHERWDGERLPGSAWRGPTSRSARGSSSSATPSTR